jgi:hypothetical protein
VDQAGPKALRDAIKHQHGCDSKWVEAIAVTETSGGKTIWDGEVQVFFLIGHPKTHRAYAWSHETGEGNRRVVAMLELGPVKDAATAVRASIAAG